jgi:hydrogenase-1 operon protein HyaF
LNDKNKATVDAMSLLQSIPVKVESTARGGFRTDNLKPLLLQIEQALEDLIGNGTDTLIDLGAMPFSEQDEHDLREHLGRGEVSATVEAFGPTLVEETAYPGVWLVEHKDAEQRRLTLHLEIARIPAILGAAREDLPDSLTALRRANEKLSDTPAEDVQ